MITIPGTIPITIHPIFWMLTFGLGWMSTNQNIILTLMWVFVATISIIVHEFGHALTAKAFGHRVEIELAGFGGATHHRGGRINSFKEFLIVLNGPLAGFLLFFLSASILYTYGRSIPYFFAELLQISVWINLYWSIFNLLPVYPMDGGQIMRIILEAIFGIRGVRFSLMVSLVLGATLALFFLWTQQIYMAALFFFLGYESYKALSSIAGHIYEQGDSKEGEIQQELRDAAREMQFGDPEEAKIKLIGIREKSKKGAYFLQATQLLGKLLIQQGRDEEALELLSPHEKNLDGETLFAIQEMLYQNGDYKKCIELGNRIFQKYPQYKVALLNATANAKLGELRSTVGWLRYIQREHAVDF